MSTLKDQLFTLARLGKADKFLELFKASEEEAFVELMEISHEIGCAAVEGKSIPILEYLNTFYEKPFEIFSEWVNHAIRLQDLELLEWMVKKIIKPDSEGFTIALGTGNVELIEMVREFVDMSEADFNILWEPPSDDLKGDTKELSPTCKQKLSQEQLDKIYEVLDEPEEMLEAAAQAKDVAFLKARLNKEPAVVLKVAIPHKLEVVYAELTSEQKQIAFPLFLEEWDDDRASALLPEVEIKAPIDTFIAAANGNCLKVMLLLAPKLELTSALVSKALVAGIDQSNARTWLLEQKIKWTSEETLAVLVAAVESHLVAGWATKTIVPLLARPEVRELPSLQPVLLAAIKAGVTNSEEDVFKLLKATGKCDFKDPQVMTLAAITRDTEIMSRLVDCGCSLEIAFRNRVTNNDSDVAVALFKDVSPELQQWSRNYAITNRNKRMAMLLV